MPPINFRDFSAEIKSKFPLYKNADDLELAKEWIDKYPLYKEQVSFDQPSAPAAVTPQTLDYGATGQGFNGKSPNQILQEHQANMAATPAASWFQRFAQAIPQTAYDVAVPFEKGALDIVPSMAGEYFGGRPGAFVGGAIGSLGRQAFQAGLGEIGWNDISPELAATEGGINMATGSLNRAFKLASPIARTVVAGTEQAALGVPQDIVESLIRKKELPSSQELQRGAGTRALFGAGVHGATVEPFAIKAQKLAKIKAENDILEAEAKKLDEAYTASQKALEPPSPVKPAPERPYEVPAPEPHVGAALPPDRQLPARVPTQPGVEKGIELATKKDVLSDLEGKPLGYWLKRFGMDDKTIDWIDNAERTIASRKAAEAAEAAGPPRETIFSSERGSMSLKPVDSDGLARPQPNEKYQDFVNQSQARAAQEAKGQQILDELDESGRTPAHVVNDFWTNTYGKLPDRGRKLIENAIQKLTSFQPGDAIAVGRNGEPITAKSWEDVYSASHAPTEVGHLEGTERGLIALMEEANRQAAKQPSRGLLGTSGGENAARQGWLDRFKGFAGNEEGSVPLHIGSERRVSHGGVGGSGASIEELNRTGTFYKVGRGIMTYLGKQVDASLKPGEAVMQVMPDGSVKTYSTEGLNFKQAESMFGNRVKQAAAGAGQRLKGFLGNEEGSVTLTPKQREARRGQEYPLTPEMDKLDKGMGPEPPANLPAGIKTAAKVGSAYDKLIEQMTDRTIMTKRYQDIAQAEYGRELPQAARAREEALRWPGRMGRVEDELQEHVAPQLKKLDGVEFKTLKRVIAAEDAITKANATGNQNRVYSGGLTWQEAQDALLDMESSLGPARWQKVQDAANAVFDYNKLLLKKDLDSGNISQKLYDELLEKYPKYNRVRILDYIKGNEEGFVGGAREFFRNSDSGIRKLTEKGTSRRMMDPLESMVMSAFETENRVSKNDIGNAIINWKSVSPTMDTLIQKVASDHKFTNAEAKMQVRHNGKQETYSIPKEMEGIFKYGETQGEWAALGKWMGKTALEAGAVRRNPVFLAVNSMTDAATAMIRGLNPKDLVKGYYSAFTDDQWAKMAKREGATMGTGFYSRDANSIVSELSSRGRLDIRDKKDLKRLADFMAFGWVSHYGEKIENAPRIAAFRKEFEKSGDALKAAVAGRDITVDFSKGGALSKKLNQLIPFFNIGIQGSLVIPRNIKDKRMWAGLGGVAATAAGFEAWNRKFSSYKDVPEQDTDNGLVLMLGEKKGKEGETVPVYAKFNLREFAAPVIAVRQAFDKAYGEAGRSWTDFAAAMAGTALPLKGEGAAGKAAQLIPPIPKGIIEVGINKKLHTGRDINPPNEMRINTPEDRFGPYQTGIAKGFSKYVGKYFGLSPRDIEAFVGTTLGTGGTRALKEIDNAKNLIPFKGKVESVSDVPLVGSMASGFYKERGGELKSKSYKAFGKDATKVTRDIFKTIEDDPTYKALDLKKRQKLQRQISNRADKMIKYKLKLLDKDKMEDYDGPMDPDQLLAVTKELLSEINDE